MTISKESFKEVISYKKMSYDSEFEKMVSADRSRRAGKNGFQGCVNYNKPGKNCDFAGFYLASYSEEGLCSKCEIAEHPERYHGCASCGYATQYGLFCWSCRGGVNEWIFKLFYNKNSSSKSTSSCFAIPTENETDNWTLWQNVGNGCHVISSKMVSDDQPKPRLIHQEKTEIDREWPGFRLTDTMYFKPDPYTFREDCAKNPDIGKIDISDITWDNRALVLMRELNKLGIFPHDEVQFRVKFRVKSKELFNLSSITLF
ncbi:hypothetical protein YASMINEVIRUS_1413 [Yasminevirus sp. GU-2018]|uniref:Uncharacterized protein n=1 Tax=Yasminevirus sp. GU-2018 TaxID=2420051 RepID=A0A5K0UB32_9VIRU|nr:hypothetical protein YASMINEVIRUS_1413 [Yasminevirus sp. GU-2018]